MSQKSEPELKPTPWTQAPHTGTGIVNSLLFYIYIILKLNQTWSSLGASRPLPNRLSPSVDNTDDVPAVERLLDKFPNPDGLPQDLIIEA